MLNNVMISERAPAVEDRAVSGHQEGDLIDGMHQRSFIATLVKRTSRDTPLVDLPDGKNPEHVAQRSKRTLTLPPVLRRSLTWDQGGETDSHLEFSIATGCPVYVCNPDSPGNDPATTTPTGLRQYFPNSTDLSGFATDQLDTVADELNRRPRKTLDYTTPSEKVTGLVASTA